MKKMYQPCKQNQCCPACSEEERPAIEMTPLHDWEFQRTYPGRSGPIRLDTIDILSGRQIGVGCRLHRGNSGPTCIEPDEASAKLQTRSGAEFYRRRVDFKRLGGRLQNRS